LPALAQLVAAGFGIRVADAPELADEVVALIAGVQLFPDFTLRLAEQRRDFFEPALVASFEGGAIRWLSSFSGAEGDRPAR